MNNTIKRSLLGLGVVAIPLAIVPTVMSCNTLNLEGQKAIGVNGIQVLDDALGVLKQYNSNINSSGAHTDKVNSFERYRMKITLINPHTKQELPISFSFLNFSKFNDLAKQIGKNYINEQSYKIEFFVMNSNAYWENKDKGIVNSYDVLNKYSNSDIYYKDKVYESNIAINNFESNLTFANMKNLKTDNIKTNIKWDEQWVGGIKHNETNK